MCVVSMVMDHYREQWQPRVPQYQPVITPQVSQAELDEFRRLLERAREYDKRHAEPDCELDEQLGVEIAFV